MIALRVPLAATALALLAASSPAAPDPVRQLAGRYSDRFRNGTVDGDTYWSDDVAEIVLVDRTHAYIRVRTSFFNGHSCSIRGVAAAEADALVYHDPAPATDYHAQCTLTVRRHGATLSIDDGETGGCKRYCGARGGFRNTEFPWSSKRAISYMTRLKRSSDYHGALTEWRTGKSTYR